MEQAETGKLIVKVPLLAEVALAPETISAAPRLAPASQIWTVAPAIGFEPSTIPETIPTTGVEVGVAVGAEGVEEGV